MPPIQDHPLRYRLANEIHARPFPAIAAPCRAAMLAFKPVRDQEPGADLAQLIALLDRHGAAHPPPEAKHYFGKLGRHLLKWEAHTEFVTYTLFRDGVADTAFDPRTFDVFPEDWLASMPGERITSALIRVEVAGTEAEVRAKLADWFVPESLAASHILDRAAIVAGDFRIDAAGHMRFAVFAAPATGERRIGRIIQRLCEIETYKSMSMLGFARAAEIRPQLDRIDAELTDLVGHMGGTDASAAQTLDELLHVSGELEDLLARTSYRFAATAAYEALVHQRIEILREERLEGRQTLAEFMSRRYDPAMRTVKATERRLTGASERATRAGNLLRTRVDVDRSAENQALLANMDRRAALQLRLQETVEGLSVVAISYYAVSLAGYLVAPLAKALGLDKGEMLAILTLPVVGAVWLMVRRIRDRLH